MNNIFKHIRKKLLKSEILSNLATLITGGAIAQLTAIAIQPILRRLFIPEDFGAYAVYVGIIGITTSISTFRYRMAIIPAETNEEAISIVNLSFIINTVVSVLLVLALVFKIDIIAELLNFPGNYLNWLYLLPFSIFLFGNYQIINDWLIRNKAFKVSATNKIARRSTEGATQLSFGIFNSSVGLVIGDVLGHVVNNIVGIYQMFRNNFELNYFKLSQIRKVAKKYIEFPKYNLLTSFLNYSCILLPVFLINKYYGEQNTGYFDLSKMVLTIPIALVSEAMFQVIFQKVSEHNNTGKKFSKDIYKIVKILFIFSIIGIILLFFFSEFLFTFIFGENWKMSADFAKILMYSFAVKFIVAPFTSVYVALRKIRILLFWQFSYFVGIISLFLFKRLMIIDFLKIYMLIDVLFYSLNFFLIYLTINNYEKKII